MSGIIVSADIIPPEEASYTPYVVTPVNSETKRVTVYGFKGTTLHVKCGGTTLAKQTYAKDGFKNISIKPQNAGKTLSFSLVTSYGKTGKAVTRKVINLCGEKQSTSLKAPRVQKTITNTTKLVTVNAQKNTTLVVKTDKAKVLGQKVYAKTGSQSIRLSIPADTNYLYFYEKAGNKRSPLTVRQVQDKTAPKTPKVTRTDIEGAVINVKGELYSYVYVNYGAGWKYQGTVLDKSGSTVLVDTSRGAMTYQVKLKDRAGNSSKAVQMKYKGDALEHN
ncbi:MAG: hypothetical protein Q4C91_09315 [Eubacteriales bacterium]|nr:hypothetical protein [Eubacteriales bacterium]